MSWRQEGHLWDRCPTYRTNDCLVCGRRTRQLVAPVGLASGSFPCHVEHLDRDIMTAYFAWCEKQFTSQPDMDIDTARGPGR